MTDAYEAVYFGQTGGKEGPHNGVVLCNGFKKLTPCLPF